MKAFVVLLACLGIAVGSFGEGAGFSVRIQNALRSASVDTVERQGVTYVSLPALIRQFGGGCTVTPERVQVDVASKTAWLRLNAEEVTSSLGSFALGHPVLESGDEALIAVSDAVALFDKAFFLDLRADKAAVKAAPATETLEAPAAEPPVVPAAPNAAAPPPAPQPVPPEPPSPPAAPKRPANRPIQVVVIDPGHGGPDMGCQGPAGAKESALDLTVALKAQKALQAADATLKVILTREKDQGFGRQDRASFAENGKGDLLVSLHCGTSLAPAASGVEVFCGLAQEGQARPGDAYVTRSLGIAKSVGERLAGQTGAKNRDVRRMPCALISDVPMCGVLIEVGCLTTPEEEAAMQTDAYQDQIAQGIAAGIAKYLVEERKGKATP
jgi:N-acetylmuramoyl-L-alanine amidase